jgi:hypothetical protein
MKNGHPADPEVLRTGSPFGEILSREWRLSGGVRRIGAALIGACYALGGLSCIVGSFRIKSELANSFGAGSVQNVLTVLLVFALLVIGFSLLALGVRFLQGVIRSKLR